MHEVHVRSEKHDDNNTQMAAQTEQVKQSPIIKKACFNGLLSYTKISLIRNTK